MAGYLGYCHRCRALSEFFDRREAVQAALDKLTGDPVEQGDSAY